MADETKTTPRGAGGNSDNTRIWEKVCVTDMAFTKTFTRGGGFKGTAISPVHLIQLATQLFGPIGAGWYYTEESQLIDGAPIIKANAVICYEKIWVTKIFFYYRDPATGEMTTHPIVQYGQTTMVNMTRAGEIKSDEEAPKKSLTDALTKVLSYLGFAADIHLGLRDGNRDFDDVKYLRGLKADDDSEPRQRRGNYVREEQAFQNQRHPPMDARVYSVDEVKRALADGVPVNQIFAMVDATFKIDRNAAEQLAGTLFHSKIRSVDPQHLESIERRMRKAESDGWLSETSVGKLNKLLQDRKAAQQ